MDARSMCEAVLALERAVRNMEALGQMQPPTHPPPTQSQQQQQQQPPLPVSYPCEKPEPAAPVEPVEQWCVVGWDGDRESDGVYYSL